MPKSGKLVKHHLNSQLLRNNPLKNSPQRDLFIFEPHQYQKKEKLPCVCFLPGFGSHPKKWIYKDFPGYKLADYLILNETLPRFLLVCIDGFTRLGGSQYLDSELNGPFASHIAQEIYPFIKKHHPNVSEFYITGHSSGGFGALHLGSLYPHLFKRVASFAGDLHFELTHKHLLVDFVNKMKSHSLGTNLRQCLNLKQQDYVLGLASAYSPNLKQPFWKMDFPIDIHSGHLIPDVWKKWLELDPLQWVKKRKNSLQKLERLYLSAGDQDEFGLHLGASAFMHSCEQNGIKAILDIHKGNHSLLLSQFQRGLEAMLL